MYRNVPHDDSNWGRSSDSVDRMEMQQFQKMPILANEEGEEGDDVLQSSKKSRNNVLQSDDESLSPRFQQCQAFLRDVEKFETRIINNAIFRYRQQQRVKIVAIDNVKQIVLRMAQIFFWCFLMASVGGFWLFPYIYFFFLMMCLVHVVSISCLSCIQQRYSKWRDSRPPALLRDKDVALLVFQSLSSTAGLSSGRKALKYMSSDLQNDRGVVMAAVKFYGSSLKHASQRLRDDEAIAREAIRNDGMSLLFCSDDIRSNKECVIAACYHSPESLKFAMGGLNQDRECLIAAGIWDEEYDNHENGLPGLDNPHENVSETESHGGNNPAMVPGGQNSKRKKIVLSTRFSLGAESSPTATSFTVALRNHRYVSGQKFVVYSPNAFSKTTCDPKWTQWSWPCRGTPGTCRMEDPVLKTGPPTDACCWRYSFRYHLEHAKRANGFMVQMIELREVRQSQDTPSSLENTPTLVLQPGLGQKIESHMARDVGVKVFRICQPAFRTTGGGGGAGRLLAGREFTREDIDKLVQKIKDWYEGGCKDMTDVDIRCGDVALSFAD